MDTDGTLNALLLLCVPIYRYVGDDLFIVSGVPPCGFLFKLEYIVIEEGSFSLLIWIAEGIYRNGYGSYFLIIPTKSLILVVVNCELT